MDLRIKKFIKYIVDSSIKFLVKIISYLPEKALKYFIARFIKNMSSYTNYYYTYHRRPKFFNKVHYSDIFEETKYSHIGLVIQGPLLTEEHFTLNSVLLYKKNYPDIKIVVSTWKNSDEKEVKLFQEKGIDIILLERPLVTGSHNINLQIISTIEGIKYLEEKGVTFICKTRTDQRIYAKNSFKYMEKLINKYPVNSNIAKGRIIEPSISVCKYRPWSMTDMFQFGYLEDMKKMWEIKLDERSQTAQDYGLKKFKVFDIVNDNIAEIYIHRNYATICELDNAISYKKYYDCIKKLFIVIDKEVIDLYWNKYDPVEYELAVNPTYEQNQLLSRIYHTDWLEMYYEDSIVNYEKFENNLYKYEN